MLTFNCAVVHAPQDGFLFSVSIVSGLICLTLAIIKFMLGKVLTSRALITDGTCLDGFPTYLLADFDKTP